VRKKEQGREIEEGSDEFAPRMLRAGTSAIQKGCMVRMCVVVCVCVCACDITHSYVWHDSFIRVA